MADSNLKLKRTNSPQIVEDLASEGVSSSPPKRTDSSMSQKQLSVVTKKRSPRASSKSVYKPRGRDNPDPSFGIKHKLTKEIRSFMRSSSRASARDDNSDTVKQASPPAKLAHQKTSEVKSPPSKIRKNCGMNSFLNSLKLQKVNTGSDLDFDPKKKKDGSKQITRMGSDEDLHKKNYDIVPSKELDKNKASYLVYRPDPQSKKGGEQVIESDLPGVVIKNGIFQEVYNPKKSIKISVRKPRSLITTKFSKRLELDHIEEMIEGMAVIPDFGFDHQQIQRDQSISGWELLRDFFLSDNKYERLENYIQACSVAQEQKVTKEKKQTNIFQVHDGESTATKKETKSKQGTILTDLNDLIRIQQNIEILLRKFRKIHASKKKHRAVHFFKSGMQNNTTQLQSQNSTMPDLKSSSNPQTVKKMDDILSDQASQKQRFQEIKASHSVSDEDGAFPGDKSRVAKSTKRGSQSGIENFLDSYAPGSLLDEGNHQKLWRRSVSPKPKRFFEHLSTEEIHIFTILKERYYETVREMFRLIYKGTSQSQEIYQMSNEDAVILIKEEERLIYSLRHCKILIGILMRMVRSQKYHLLSEEKREIADILHLLPEFQQDQVIDFFERKKPSSHRSPDIRRRSSIRKMERPSISLAGYDQPPNSVPRSPRIDQITENFTEEDAFSPGNQRVASKFRLREDSTPKNKDFTTQFQKIDLKLAIREGLQEESNENTGGEQPINPADDTVIVGEPGDHLRTTTNSQAAQTESRNSNMKHLRSQNHKTEASKPEPSSLVSQPHHTEQDEVVALLEEPGQSQPTVTNSGPDRKGSILSQSDRILANLEQIKDAPVTEGSRAEKPELYQSIDTFQVAGQDNSFVTSPTMKLFHGLEIQAPKSRIDQIQRTVPKGDTSAQVTDRSELYRQSLKKIYRRLPKVKLQGRSQNLLSQSLVHSNKNPLVLNKPSIDAFRYGQNKSILPGNQTSNEVDQRLQAQNIIINESSHVQLIDQQHHDGLKESSITQQQLMKTSFESIDESMSSIKFPQQSRGLYQQSPPIQSSPKKKNSVFSLMHRRGQKKQLQVQSLLRSKNEFQKYENKMIVTCSKQGSFLRNLNTPIVFQDKIQSAQDFPEINQTLTEASKLLTQNSSIYNSGVATSTDLRTSPEADKLSGEPGGAISVDSSQQPRKKLNVFSPSNLVFSSRAKSKPPIHISDNKSISGDKFTFEPYDKTTLEETTTFKGGRETQYRGRPAKLDLNPYLSKVRKPGDIWKGVNFKTFGSAKNSQIIKPSQQGEKSGVASKRYLFSPSSQNLSSLLEHKVQRHTRIVSKPDDIVELPALPRAALSPE